MPDVRHGQTLLEGCLVRFCANPPLPDRRKLRRFKRFVWHYVKRFEPIHSDADVSVEKWLENTTTYSAARRLELLTSWNLAGRCMNRERDFLVKSFGKVETYPKFKAARGINSRTDVFKCFSGPYFKLIENEIYKDPAFIKHTPVRLRPAYIQNMLAHLAGPYYETDYSQFEKHFTKDFMMTCEMELYRHMMQSHIQAFKHIKKAMTGKNRCIFRDFRITIEARRMSGEMCTSLGNGFSNLMLAKFIVFEKTGRDALTGVVEGDDGLFACPCDLTKEDFEGLGFDIKILKHDNLLRTSFCGIVMSEDLATMTDPREVLVNFGWSHSPLAFGNINTRMSLLRAKALSLAYEHPSCPILSKLATRILVLTTGYTPRFVGNVYEQQLFLEMERFKEETAVLLLRGPSLQTRRDFAAQFDIPIWQQMDVELALQSITISEIVSPAILGLFGTEFEPHRRYYEEFCCTKNEWMY